MKRNIILITADQMRGDCISALGHPDVKTPFLDMMINKGVVFGKAYSATPTCIPARAALFTGLTQRSHKRVGYKDGVPWDYKTTLPKVFSDNGYHTQCVGKMHVWPPRSLMGFHNVELHDGFLPNRNTNTSAHMWWSRVDDYIPYLQQQAGYNADINDLGIDCNSWVSRPYTMPEYTHPTNWTVTRSIDFLRRRDPTKPFFLWTSFVAPHPPLIPPTYYFDMYKGKKMRKPYIGSWAKEIGREHPDVDCFEGKLEQDEIQQMQAGYYGLITHLDHQIGRLIRALKDEGILDNTVILFTSDHGEMLGDHNMFRKSQAFEGSVSVPMILFDPGDTLNLQRGKQFSRLVELRDVMPTLLDAAELPVPDCVEGKSFLHCEDEQINSRNYLHGEHASQVGKFSTQYIVTHNEKYIWFSHTGEEMLFNLKGDPHELENVAQFPEYSSNLGRLRAILVKELAGREEGYSDGQNLYIGKIPKMVLQ